MYRIKEFWNSLRVWIRISICVLPILILIQATHKTKQELVTLTETEIAIAEDLKEVRDSIKLDTFTEISDTILFLLNFEQISNEHVKKFVERFLNTAIVEKHKFNIPISIKLTQGIIESACGNSRLTKKANNFFGMKCKKRCKSCNGKDWKVVDGCVNAKDDGADDLFRMFPNAWESWRAHSLLLTIPRYAKLRQLEPTDYKSWAKGLKKAGYATSNNYAESIIKYIEQHKLDEFDKMDLNQLAKQRNIDLTKIPKYD